MTRNAQGAIESVRYHELVPMLLNEAQHQRRELADLHGQNAALAARLERLEAAARMVTVTDR